MKRSLLLALFVCAISYVSEAKILRVAYAGPQVAGTDYPNVQAAVNAATAGDTIHLYQNAAVGNASVNKRLVFFGFGHRLDVNTGLQAVPSANNSCALYFNAGSENSFAQGVYFSTSFIGANNITISRCYGSLYLGYNTNGQHVNISNPVIVSSFIDINAQWGTVSNALISNSILTNLNVYNLGGLITNNVITASTNNYGSCVVKNNIYTYQWSCPSGTNAVYQNNLFRAGCNMTGSGNSYNVDMANVFVNWNNGNFGPESNLALKSGSPAIGFGIDGNGSATDAGIYGGEAAYVYKPAGIPAIPSIYQLTAPQINTSTNPYTITISVRSNN